MSNDVALGPGDIHVVGVSSMNSPPPERYQEGGVSQDQNSLEEQSTTEEFETIEQPDQTTPTMQGVPLLTRLNDVNGNKSVYRSPPLNLYTDSSKQPLH
jgi:hypothetical protein